MSVLRAAAACLCIATTLLSGCAGTGAGTGAARVADPVTQTVSGSGQGEPLALPSPGLLHAWFATAKAWVEEETGTTLTPVRLKLTSRDEMQAIGDATLSHLFIDKPVSFKLLKQHKLRNSGYRLPSVVALFDPVLNTILLAREGLEPFSRTVSKNGTSLEDAYKALFIHELIHAVDYLNYPDNIIFSQKNLGNLAVRAVVEGHAQYLTNILCQKRGCQQGYRSLRDDVVSSVDLGSRTGARAGEALSNFCYLHGERFFASIESRPGAIGQVLAHPPTDPVMIRYPQVFLAGIRAQRQRQIANAFQSVTVPWNPERSLLLHNTSFVPFKGYNPQRQLAQNNYEVLHESAHDVNTTNINIFWKSSSGAASSFFRRLLNPGRKRLSGDGQYEVRLLNKSQQDIVLASAGSVAGGRGARLGTLEFSHKPTRTGLLSSRRHKVQQIFVATSGPFVVSVARTSPKATEHGLRSYTTKLLQALRQVNPVLPQRIMN